MIHDFHERLHGSIAAEGDRRTELIVRKYFASAPDFAIDWSARERPYGHDFEVRAFGQRYTFEEKRRRRDYGDELLEDVSNDRTGRSGWAWSCSSTDFVLFVYPRRFSIYPGEPLERAFRRRRDEWVSRFGRKAARNVGYSTLSIAIPSTVVRGALREEGIPDCVHCNQPVGRYRSRCAGSFCSAVTCCVVTDGEWYCDACNGLR